MADDYAADTTTTGTVAVGGSATGDVETRWDYDWFKVTLEAGKVYRIDLEGAATDAGTLSWTFLRGVYDASGNYISGTADIWSGTGDNSRSFFVPDSAGTYYIAAGGVYRTGTYRLSVTEVTDDHPASTSTTGTVAVGGSATGELEFGGDRDWFAVTLEANKTYRIDLEGTPTNAGTLRYTHLYGVYDAQGDLISGTSNAAGGAVAAGYYGWNSRLVFEPAEAGTYYIAASEYHGSRTGTYRVSVTEVGTDDHAAGITTTATVAVGGSATGEIERGGDRDWFAVTLEAGTFYLIDLEGAPANAGTLGDPYLYGLYDAQGNRMAGTSDDNGGSGLNSRLEFEPTADGTYYIAAGGDDNHTGTYRVSVREFADDYSANSITTGRVTVGGSATGNIERAGDEDWFAVTLEAGITYRIDLEGADTNAGTLADPTLGALRDQYGNENLATIDYNSGTGLNARDHYTPWVTGTYFLVAEASGNGTGTYRLSVSEAVDDHPGNTDTTGRVAVGGSVRGEFEVADDRDWFAVTLEAGTRYRIDLEGDATNVGTMRSPVIAYIRDQDGNRIEGTYDGDGGAYNDDAYNARVFFEPEADGTYYIAAADEHGNSGTYRLSVTAEVPETPDDHPAGTTTTGTVAVDGSTTGNIENAGDRDWFQVTLEAGTRYRIDLEGARTNAGSLNIPVLFSVYDQNGNAIEGTYNDGFERAYYGAGGSSRNARVFFEPETGGTYYIAATSQDARTGTYRLSVTEVVADLPAGTDTTGTVAVDGSATGEIERPYDRDWFSVALEAGTRYRIDLEGSPTDAGTLRDPYLRGVHDANGNLIHGTTNDDGGDGWNSRLDFEPAADGTYYIAAGAYGSRTGTYEVSVEEL